MSPVSEREQGVGLTVSAVQAAYGSGEATPADVVTQVFDRVARELDNPIWIALRDKDQVIAEARSLAARPGAASLPLYGVPFGVKDNIDVAGMPTTAACRSFSYTPARSATVVDLLRAAGALLIGKTNLDQFATGLVGTRSPYGVVRNAYDPGYISGGSSSGSAVAVARSQVSFALGTDTAGSGRIPAGFNNIVGCKPTRGLFSTLGVVPACRSLDCVSIFSGNVADAARVFSVLDVFDPEDALARDARSGADSPSRRLRIGVPQPADLEFFGDAEYARLFGVAVDRLAALDVATLAVDIHPFIQAGSLLYDGPWVAERYAAVGSFIARGAEGVDPIVREIIEKGAHYSAADTFRGMYRMAELRRAAARIWTSMDALLMPTAGTIYKIAEINASPVALNTNLGRYTNFVNLLDLAGLALPAGFRTDGLPFGITFLAPALHDRLLFELGARWEGQRAGAPGTGALPPAGRVRLAVVGAHLSGEPLNGQLTARGATLVRACRTAPIYRLYALPETHPPKPGLVRDTAGSAIEVEIWEMNEGAFGSLVASIPSPLAIGTLLMEDGEQVHGFLCEAHAVSGAPDISSFGGWRAYLREGGR